MKIQHVANIVGGQDGAIFGDELFRFDHKGNGKVYNLRDLNPQEVCDLTPTATFVLDRADVLVPHANAVCFGTERYEPGDFYPLLYSNIYNNYAKTENPYIGVCCVYRLQKTADGFVTTLVQLIEIGFCEDATLWRCRSKGTVCVPMETSWWIATPPLTMLSSCAMRRSVRAISVLIFPRCTVANGIPFWGCVDWC